MSPQRPAREEVSRAHLTRDLAQILHVNRGLGLCLAGQNVQLAGSHGAPELPTILGSDGAEGYLNIPWFTTASAKQEEAERTPQSLASFAGYSPMHNPHANTGHFALHSRFPLAFFAEGLCALAARQHEV